MEAPQPVMAEDLPTGTDLAEDAVEVAVHPSDLGDAAEFPVDAPRAEAKTAADAWSQAGAGNGAPAPRSGPGIGEPGDNRIFIGGLSRDTSEQALAMHFGQFGGIVHVNIALNKLTGMPRGFGFVKFADAEGVEKALNHERHHLDGRDVDVKRAVTRAELEAQGVEKKGMGAAADAQKLFVGGLTDAIGEQELRMYMSIFGTVTGVQIVCDAATGRPRGFAFVTFEVPDAVSNVLRHQVSTPHIIKGSKVEVKPFISGGLAGANASAPQQKIFVGGLPREITEAAIYEYFGTFGQVVNVHNYKGYCFVTFMDPTSVQHVLSTGAKSHSLMGKQVEVKPYTEQRMMNRGGGSGHGGFAHGGVGGYGGGGGYGGANDFNAPDGTPDEQKVFIGGCSVDTTEVHLSQYFSHYGQVLHAKIARDPVSGRSKGFAFVAFADSYAAQQAIAAQQTRKHEILGRSVDLRPYAKPRGGQGGGQAGGQGGHGGHGSSHGSGHGASHGSGHSSGHGRGHGGGHGGRPVGPFQQLGQYGSGYTGAGGFAGGMSPGAMSPGGMVAGPYAAAGMSGPGMQHLASPGMNTTMAGMPHAPMAPGYNHMAAAAAAQVGMRSPSFGAYMSSPTSPYAPAFQGPAMEAYAAQGQNPSLTSREGRSFRPY
uniref:RRM domain-containing protein n=2 Tax=Phaeomonas parva TaxID=124430 RepID=A0A7S1TQK0_9STRA|mmetsp:Transcript_10303/g.30827  ORF Transcript_10303/g.30827 Transcript_10303/m.30827 type:complete len:651 (+) Transcript_10303:251-2203(+)